MLGLMMGGIRKDGAEEFDISGVICLFATTMCFTWLNGGRTISQLFAWRK